jgi:hypothetical protein
MAPLAGSVPVLKPGESVELSVALPAAPAGDRQVAWITLVGPDGVPLTQLGSPALQLGSTAP